MRLIDANKLREDILTDKTNDPDVVNYYINMLDGMETQQAYTWIPVSKATPLTIKHDDGSPMEYIVILEHATVPTMGVINADNQWGYMDWGIPRFNLFNNNVIAWMPLPESYKEDKSERN